MSATGLAGALDAPILLTSRNELSSCTAQTVKELGATRAYIIGGTGAVSYASVEGTFSTNNIVRLSDQDGYDTSNQIAPYMVANNKLSASCLCIANGAEVPKGTDALAGAALAGKSGGVMLLGFCF